MMLSKVYFPELLQQGKMAISRVFWEKRLKSGLNATGGYRLAGLRPLPCFRKKARTGVDYQQNFV
jgi:hypothetical protein